MRRRYVEEAAEKKPEKTEIESKEPAAEKLAATVSQAKIQVDATKLAAKAVVDAVSKSFDEAFHGAPTTPAPKPSSGDDVSDMIDDLSLGAGVDRIVRSIFDVEPVEKDYQRLRERLKPTNRASGMSVGLLMDALDECSDLAQQAAELLAVAKASLAEFEIGAIMIESTLRQEAIRELKDLKNEGKGKSTINDDDVRSMMAKMFPDQFYSLSKKREEAKRGVQVVESLHAQWCERQKDVRAMLSKSRGE